MTIAATLDGGQTARLAGARPSADTGYRTRQSHPDWYALVMTILHRPRAWRGPPLALQILGLLIGGLVVAQAVTLLLTLLLPPEPPARYGIADIAAALRSPDATRSGLQREVLAAAPDTTGRGWLVSETSQGDLARQLGVDPGSVRLSFYTPLPFAGTVALPPADPGNMVGLVDPGQQQQEEKMRPASLLVWRDDGTAVTPDLRDATAAADRSDRLMRSELIQAAPGAGSPGGPLPGGPGGFPGGGFPGGGLPGGGLPGGGFPGGGMPHGGMPGGGFPGGRAPTGPGGGLPPAGPTSAGAPATTTSPTAPGSSATGGALSQSQLPAAPPSGAMTQPPPSAGSGQPLSPTRFGAPASRPQDHWPSPPSQAVAEPQRLPRDSAVPTTRRTEPAPAVPMITGQPFVQGRPMVRSDAVAPAGGKSRSPATPANPLATRAPGTGIQGAIDQARGLLGLGPSPFVQGDFVAAVRLSDGRWAVVQPAAAAFLSPWQKRVALWFLLSLALVAPVGWLFARRLSRPLDRFAEAAAQLGRDPSAAITPLDGPAEIGRAAHAFNLMQTRLRSFVDDRTAMVGAISHDLRTPLTRLRFRIEDVPDDVRDGVLQEVDEMEAMIASVLSFIRDASTQGARERLDLRTLLDDVAEDAAVIGADVPITASQPATVEVEVLGMRRVLANLVENALKYGDHARIELSLTGQEAIAAVIDDGPGIPDEELEQVFQPFYRTAAARVSSAPGTGLGLAVCRSIARAHGGDVKLCRTDAGFRAEVRVPLVYAAQYAMAA